MLMRVADEFGFKIRTFQHVPRGLQGRERDRQARRRAARPSPTGGPTRWRPTTRSPTTPAIMAAHGVRGLAQLRLGRAGAPALLGGGQGREVRRRQRGRGAEDGHAQSRLAARRRQARGLARSRQGRRHRDLQRASLLSRRAGRDDAGGRHGLLRSRQGRRSRAKRPVGREVRSEAPVLAGARSWPPAPRLAAEAPPSRCSAAAASSPSRAR